jgi:hypothetical protein
MDKNAHPVFAGILGAFGGAAYQNVAALRDYAIITVPSIEVTLHPRGMDGRDVHFDQTGFITEEQTQRAYLLLAERHADELELIAEQIVRGDLA